MTKAGYSPSYTNWLWLCNFFLLSILPYSKALTRKSMCFLEVSLTLTQTTVKQLFGKNLTQVSDTFTSKLLSIWTPFCRAGPVSLFRHNPSNSPALLGSCFLLMKLLYKHNCSKYSDKSATWYGSRADRRAKMSYQLVCSHRHDSFLFNFSFSESFWRHDGG